MPTQGFFCCVSFATGESQSKYDEESVIEVEEISCDTVQLPSEPAERVNYAGP